MVERFITQTTFTSQEDFINNLKIDVPQNFNFGYDVVDAWAAEQPDKNALLWTNDKGESRQFSFADMKRYTAFLGSLVFGTFTTWISQYVITVANSDFAQVVIGVILPVNAVVVVTLQYTVGKRITPDNLKKLMTLGSLFFLLGLATFMFAAENLYIWAIGAFLFTLGELIYAPGEYMLIDSIAPEGMKASYFSAQSLGLLGGAFNPMMTGVILTELPSYFIFIILMIITFLAWLSMLNGMRLRQNQLDHVA